MTCYQQILYTNWPLNAPEEGDGEARQEHGIGITARKRDIIERVAINIAYTQTLRECFPDDSILRVIDIVKMEKNRRKHKQESNEVM